MKAILEFNLPEDNEEFKLANQASDFSLVLHEFDQFLREHIKYASDDQPEQVTETYETIRSKLYEVANSYRIEI